MEKWLIVGLGNPGLKYSHTRHNVGFDAVDLVAKGLRSRINKTSCGAKITRVEYKEKLLVLAKPLSYMNLSGTPTNCLANANQVPSDHWIIIQDDIDLPVGALRVRKNGSSGGHKGINSIHQVTGKTDFYRIKIGVGRPETQDDVVDFVLQKARGEENQLILDAVICASRAALMLINEGIEKTGNRFNYTPKEQQGEN